MRVLGPVGLLADDGAPLPVGGPKERALLAVLACHAGRMASEERLVDALWADEPPRTARRTLQSYLSRLRRTLSMASADGALQLESGPGGWMLRVGPDALDLLRVGRLSQSAREAADRGDHLGAALALRDALAEWRGRPLEEFVEHAWAVLESSRLQELELSLVERRVDAELACGRHAELVGELEQSCHVHPFRERLWAQRMIALYRAGRQAEALRVYQDLREMLAHELGIDPSPTVTRLEQQILTQDPALDLSTATTATPALDAAEGDRGDAGPETAAAEVVAARPSVDVPLPEALAALAGVEFVGRDVELSALDKTWSETRTGGCRVVFVAGEPGIGKTTLVSRLAATAKDAGSIVMFGRCDEENLVPFQPFVEAIGQYADAVSPDRLRSDLGSQAADLALLLPGLHRRLPEVSGVAGTGAETERYRIFEAVVALFSSLTESQPVVLVLDDLHWAGAPTLGLLKHLIRGAKEQPLLVLGTYRDTDLVRTQPLAETLVELRRAELISRVHLAGLVLGDVLDLVTGGKKHTDADVELAVALWRETEGSPLFLREILRHLAESAVISRDEEGRYVALRRIDQLGIPEGVREVIGRRLSRLSEEANIALRCGSVLGREIRMDVIERVTELPTDSLLDAMDEAVAAGVVEEVPGTAGRWSFTHALVRQTLYEELSLSRRVRLHQRVGDALEGLEPDEGPHLAELAYHYAQAAVSGTTDKAITYARRAGDYNIRLAAYEQAARHFASAVEVAEDAGERVVLLCDLLLAQGYAEWRAGATVAARRIFDRVMELAGEQDAERLALAALGYSGSSTRTWWVEMFVVNDLTIGRLERAIAAYPDGDSALRAQLLAALAQELYFDETSMERRDGLSSEALAMARRLGDPANLARILVARVLSILGPDYIDEVQALANELLALARDELHDAELQATALRLRIVYCPITELDRAYDDLRAWESLVNDLRDPSAALIDHFIMATIAISEGRFEEAEQLALAGFHKGQEIRDRNAVGAAATAIANLRLYQGRGREMLPIADACKEIYPRGSLWAEAMLAGGYAEIGEPALAAGYLNRVGPPTALPRNAIWFLGIMLYARACYWLDDVERGEICYELMAGYGDISGLLNGLGAGSFQLPLALAAAAAGRVEFARRHFETAIEQNAANGWRAPLVDALVHYGRFLSRLSDAESVRRAPEVLRHGLDLAEELGAARHREIALAALERGSVVEPPASSSGHEAANPVTRRRRAAVRVATRGRAAVARWTRGSEDEELVRRFSSALAQRTLFAAVSKSFVPARAYGFSGDIVLELRAPDDELDPAAADWWTIEVRGRRATARRGRSEAPAVVVHVALATFVRIVAGEIHPVRALIDAEADVDGDAKLAVRIPDMFSAIGPMEGQLVGAN